MTQNSNAPLAGKRALVTGGSRGIGAAIARRLAADGADVAITYVSSPDKARVVVDEIVAAGRKAVAIAADSGDARAVERSVAEAASTLGGLDIIVANAGVAIFAPVDQASIEDYERTFDVNVKGVFAAAKGAAAHLPTAVASSSSAASTPTGCRSWAAPSMARPRRRCRAWCVVWLATSERAASPPTSSSPARSTPT